MPGFRAALLLALVGATALAVYLGSAIGGDPGPTRRALLPGPTTHGHYQIELSCSACHTRGAGVVQDACNACHAEELARVDDSHPVIKFNDPRNAERLERLDARRCTSCHREHQPELTGAMGLTLPADYCAFCHQTIAQDRPSHAGLPFDSCASAGCHNFHDNTALYERFLGEHFDEPDFKRPAHQLPRRRGRRDAGDGDGDGDGAATGAGEAAAAESATLSPSTALGRGQAEIPADVAFTHRILFDWSTTAHAAAGVNCNACHQPGGGDGPATAPVDLAVATPGDPGTAAPGPAGPGWVDRPGHQACSSCHPAAVEGFLQGRHGMRLAQGLSPMTPGQARLPMKAAAAHRELTCTSCHQSHRFDTRRAAVDACLQCHDDTHSTAYKASPHYTLFQRAGRGEIPEEAGVSCATCHLPRQEDAARGAGVGALTRVDHNQNNTLRPNEKMVRAACLRCHGLQFTLDALADTDLIRANFRGRPAVNVRSLEMVREELRRLGRAEP